MHKTIVYVLGILQRYPAQNPFRSTVMKIDYENSKELTNAPEVALFYEIVAKIKEAANDKEYGITLNGIFIRIDPLDVLEQLFIDTKDLYRYILAGYFSRSKYELFQRLVKYFVMLVEHWDDLLDNVLDAISHDASKGDGWMMGEVDLIDFVKMELTFINTNFTITPTHITEKYFEPQEIYVNFAKIVEDELHNDPAFIKFRNRRFSSKTKLRLNAEVKAQIK